MDIPVTILSSAPVRINDIGGWTDTWFSGKGKVLNTAVGPGVRVEVAVTENRDRRRDRVCIQAFDYDEKFRVDPENPEWDLHPLLQGAVHFLPPPRDFCLDISLRSPVPAGSSTGTSASVCVALLGALDRLRPRRLSRQRIAAAAHRVETELLGLQSGIQDQIAAAYGGICFIDMGRYPRARVTRLTIGEDILEDLRRRLCLVFLGSSHRSSEIHDQVIAFLKKMGSRDSLLERLRSLAQKARDALVVGDLDGLGRVMAENNECQRALHEQLIPAEADAVIEAAKFHGASGWKVNGAGGKGGSLTILAGPDPQRKERMIESIEALGGGIKPLPLALDGAGLNVSISPSGRN